MNYKQVEQMGCCATQSNALRFTARSQTNNYCDQSDSGAFLGLVSFLFTKDNGRLRDVPESQLTCLLKMYAPNRRVFRRLIACDTLHPILGLSSMQ